MLKCTICSDGWFWFDPRDKKVKITCGSKHLYVNVVFNLRTKETSQVLTEEEIQEINASENCERFTRKPLICAGCQHVIKADEEISIHTCHFYHKQCKEKYQKDIDSFLTDDEKAFFQHNEEELKKKQSAGLDKADPEKSDTEALK